MLWTILFLLFGFVLIIQSADLLIDGSAGVAKKLRIPKIVIGLTLVAFGTSAPEGTVSIIAALQKSSDLSVGNIIGSNIANIALVLGLAAFLRTLPVMHSTFTRGLPLNVLASAVLIIFGYDTFFQNHSTTFNRFSLGEGLVFICFFIIFLYYIYADFKIAEVQEEAIVKKEKAHFKDTAWYLAILIIGGLAGLMAGGKLVVDNAVILARAINVSEALIGLTIVAVGTSLPELATSVMAAIKKENDLAVGNIVGSNIFNIFLVLGATAVISPISFDSKLLLDAMFMFAVSILLFILVMRKRQLARADGIVLLAVYVVYIIALGFRENLMAFLPPV